MDIRIINTKNNLASALLTCLEKKNILEVKVKDITQVSNVSVRTFYKYYSDVYSLVRDVEDNFIEEYCRVIDQDRAVLMNIDLDEPIEKQLIAILKSTSTISFCFKHKREIQILLSDNGDIRFYNRIFKVSCDMFIARIERIPNLRLTEKERMAMNINVQVYVASMIGLVRVLLQYQDRFSPNDVRKNIVEFLHKTPLEDMSHFINHKKEKKKSGK